MFGFRYPAVILLAGTVIGTVLGRRVDLGLPLIAAVFIAAACFLIFGFLRLSPTYYVFPLTLLVLSAATLNANKTYRSFPANDVGRLAENDERLRFFGQIVKWPVLKRHKTILACRIDSVAADGMIESASGTVLLEINRETTHFVLGDRISFGGRLRKPYSGGYPGQFDYERYLRGRGVRGLVTVGDPSYVLVLSSQSNPFGKMVKYLRQWITVCFHKNLGDLPAALASGFLIGETRDIPDDVYRAFRRTGTMHLLAVSGSNVALVLAVIVFLIRYIPLPRAAKTIVLLVIIVVFSHLSYNQPSVVRASIMAALIIIARGMYRRAEMHNIIAAAAVILIFYDPGNLYDIGFQLSFAVTWGLILFLPQINRLIVDRQMSKPVRYILLILFSSLIATIISAPITIYYFGEVSLVTAFSNLLVVPLVSAAVIGIAVLLLTNLILPGMTILPGMFLHRLLELIHAIVVWFDQWKFATAGPNVITADCALAFLLGVALILPAFRSRFMRRILAVYFVVVGIYFGAVILRAAPPVRDIEIYNMGTTQTVIINRGGGIVLYHQNEYSRHDGFANELIPYLTRRPYPFPRYFVFVEPRYRTELRLIQMAENGLSPVLRPLRDTYINVDDITASAWTLGDQYLNSLQDSCGSIDVFQGMVAVHLSDSSGILFAASPDSIILLPAKELERYDYCLIGARDNSQLRQIAALIDNKKAVALLRRPADKYSIISEESTSWKMTAIVESGKEPFYLELPSDRKGSF